MAKLESLIVDLQANTANLEKGLNAANAKLANFDKQIKGLLGLVALKKIGEEALAVGAQVAAFVGKSIDALDAYGKKAKLTGDTAEELSRVGYAFRQTGVSADEFSKFTTKLGESLSKAAAGGEEQRALFQALGVSATDASGNVRKTTAVIGDLSKKFAELKDGPAKAQLAIELFGKGGEAMVETLNKGSAALEAAGAEADRFGQTVTSEAADGAGRFNDGLEQLSSMVDGFGKQLAADILPVLNKVLTAFLDNAGGIDLMKSGLKGVGELFKTLGFAASVFASIWDELVLVIKDAATAFFKLQQFDIGGALQAAASMERGIKKLGDAAAKAGEDFYAPAAAADENANAQTKSAEAVLRGAARAKAALDAQKKAAQEAKSALAELTRMAEGFEVQLETFGQNDPVAELTARIEHGDLKGKFDKLGDAAGAMKDRILTAVAALQDLADQKFSHELNFKLSIQLADIKNQATLRTAAFNQARNGNNLQGHDALGQAQDLFSGFDAAVTSWKASMQAAAEASAQAALAAQQGNTSASEKYQLVALAAEKSATVAGEAADAYQQMAIEVRTRSSQVAKFIVSQFTSILGDLGDIIQAAIQGFQQGGVWGAVIAAIVALLSKWSGFQKMIDALNSAIGNVLKALEPLLNIFSSIITNVVGGVLNDIARGIGNVFTALKPLFNVISFLVSIITPLFDAFKALTDALDPFKFAVVILSVVFNVIGLVLLGIARGIVSIAQGILYVVKKISDAFGGNKDIDKAYADVEGTALSIDDKMKRIAKNIANPNALDDTTVTDLGDQMHGLGGSLGGLTVASDNATAAIADFSNSLTNTPQGFRYAALAFDSQGLSGESVFGNQSRNITLEIDGEKLADIMEKISKRRNFRRNGFGG